MDPPEDTFAFDFFEEGQPSRGRRGMRGLPRRGRGGDGGPPRQLAALLRLAAVVCVAILVLLLFALGVSSCAGTSTGTLDANYMNAVASIAQRSSADGTSAVDALTTPGLTVHVLQAKLDAVAAGEQQEVQAAERLAPPGPLRPENADLIESLQLRVDGVEGLADDVARVDAKGVSTSDETLELATQAQRLLASDVIWDDLFAKPAGDELVREGVGGVAVPVSHFLASPELVATPNAMALVVSRIAVQSSSTNGTSCTGVHGTSLVSVDALPKGVKGKSQALSSSSLNTVTTDTSLIVEATVHDAGRYQEVQIPVELTIERPSSQGGPLEKKETVPVIDPGQNVTVTFGGLANVPFTQTNMTVDVAAVCGETDLADNTATYRMLFSLPTG